MTDNLIDNSPKVNEFSLTARLRESPVSCFIGLLLFLGSFPGEFWNEGRAITEFKALTQGAKKVTSVSPDSINPQYEGKLIHVSGLATNDGILVDPKFGVKTNGLKLRRSVEMYQWVEKEEDANKKIYSYKKTWSSDSPSSKGFDDSEHHHNPDSMPFDSDTYEAKLARVGAFTIDTTAFPKLTDYTALKLEDTKVDSISGKPAKVVNSSTICNSKNPDSPEVGDVKVSFSDVPPQQVSIIARQHNGSLEPFGIDRFHKIEILKLGSLPSDAMFKQEEATNYGVTWMLRIYGFLSMFFGLVFIRRPLFRSQGNSSTYVTFSGLIWRMLFFVADFLLSLILLGGILDFCAALVLSTVTMGLAWLVFRPLIGIGIIGGGLAISYVLSKGVPKKASSP